MPITEESFPSVIEAIKFSLEFRLFDNAFMLCEEAISCNLCPEIIELYAKSFLEIGSPKQAAILCKNNIHVVMSSPNTIIIYAKSLIESGDLVTAEDVLYKFLLSCIDNNNIQYKVAAQYYLGLIMNRTSRFSSSKPLFNDCLLYNKYLVSARKNMLIDAIPKETNEIQISDNISTLTLLENPQINPDEIEFPPNFRESIPYLIQKGDYYFHRSNFTLACREYKKLYENYPYNTHGLAFYSTALWQLKGISTLTELSRYLTSIAPGSAETWIVVGNLSSAQHMSDQAVEYFIKASKIDRSCSYGLTLAGHEYLSLGRDSDAQDKFRDAVSRSPLEYSAWYGLGTILYKEKKYAAARYYIRKAQTINRDSSVLMSILAQTELMCGDSDVAIDLFKKSVAMDKTNYAAKFQLGCAYQDIQKLEEAKEEFSQVASFAPDEPMALFKLGQVFMQQENFDIALHYFVEALIYGYPIKTDIYDEIESIIDDIIKKCLK
ncbi:TPR Domain containing protein [Trichomonas vaginalis G3]|uniref:TPR Domain containing protein n=1 Tax=Trichomonas vaginalis (strain ATCC PRA-98 / G3) TaxID=412133 RepID=A2ESU1_TRIV3|nr:metaphase/anaphase transition of mitotic cell cycle [Trichomonas vaginalis G3]EAY04267.1 TPR Domain containing protein [Trichomonas vaginalis G3]KAI5549360.1 metaphase/anaphase transition of mitotic cell cycle [Trichomonas vaginalis G3]|eukprot:XP_001316490.1 TPR Domain containing protein [Trichomonas vaginalis G3]